MIDNLSIMIVVKNVILPQTYACLGTGMSQAWREIGQGSAWSTSSITVLTSSPQSKSLGRVSHYNILLISQKKLHENTI